LLTDHKPLTSIFGPNKGIPTLAAARLQRWALLLSAYTYEIKYRPTQNHANADILSRLPLEQVTDDATNVINFDSVFSLGQVEVFPITAKQIAVATSKDPILVKVLQFVYSGWPDNVDAMLTPYFNCKNEISVESSCLMRGIRVIVPAQYQKVVLDKLHMDHPGISRMKSLARSYVWWPNIDDDITQLVKSCIPCHTVKSNPPKFPLNPWLWATKLWSRIHIDFAGRKTYFVIVDAHSKWPEVFTMNSTTSSHTIDVLRHLFACYGIPDQIVSDNGPQFTSEEFSLFLRSNSIRHTLSPPYHHSTNGLAERFIKTLKQVLIASKDDKRSAQHRLESFLLKYRSTNHAVTGVSPSELFFKRKLKTVLDLVKPDVSQVVYDKQVIQKQHHDQHSSLRNIDVGDLVMVKNYTRDHQSWLPGVVTEKYGTVMFVVKLTNGTSRRCHIDQLRRREIWKGTHTQNFKDNEIESDKDDEIESDKDNEEELTESFQVFTQADDPPIGSTHPSSSTERYPSRHRSSPVRFSDLYI
jgi:hypothetical protein